jgi:alkaline phosphatase D
MSNEVQRSRRNFIKTAGLALGAGFAPTMAGHSSIIGAGNSKALSGQPQLTQGIQFGDVLSDRPSSGAVPTVPPG